MFVAWSYLCNGVVVWPLDEDCAAVGVLHILNKCVLLISQHMLIHSTSMTLQNR